MLVQYLAMLRCGAFSVLDPCARRVDIIDMVECWMGVSSVVSCGFCKCTNLPLELSQPELRTYPK